jgi:hypothetical protein
VNEILKEYNQAVDVLLTTLLVPRQIGKKFHKENHPRDTEEDYWKWILKKFIDKQHSEAKN